MLRKLLIGKYTAINNDAYPLSLIQHTIKKYDKTGQKSFIDLGIYDIAAQAVNKIKLAKSLIFIRENRALGKDVVFERLKAQNSN